ncbi:MAG: oxidoreductase [Blastocatellia bacterium]
MSNWTKKDMPSQNGKLAIVTGSTSGIGYETALALAEAGAEVVVAARNQTKGREAVARILRTDPTASVRFEELDLASLASVADFAGLISKQGRAVDLLINNAGVMALPTRRTTKDGFEMQFGTNHLGHFALTARLLPLLLRGHDPRITNVSSLAHRQGPINFDDLQWERRYSPWAAYVQSKLANLLFTFELQRLSERNGWNLLANAAHPGYARTDLIANGPGNTSFLAMSTLIVRPLFSHSSAGGALPTLYAATAPEAKPGGYYGPNGFYEMKGAPAPAYIASRAKDEAAARRLWEISVKLTGVDWLVDEKSASAGNS